MHPPDDGREGDREESESPEDEAPGEWEEDGEWDDEGNSDATGEEDDDGRREPVSFDRSGLKTPSKKDQSRFFAARRELVRDAKSRERRQNIFSWIVLPTVVTVVIVGAITYTVRQVYFSEGETELLSPPGVPVPVTGEAESESGSYTAAEAGSLPSPGDAAGGGRRESDLERSLNTARRLLEEQKSEDARKLLAVLAQRYPNSPELWILHGYAVMSTAPANAGAFARRALELEPGNREALDLLSAAFEVTRTKGLTPETELKLIELEIEHYAKLLERTPDLPELLYRSASQRIALHRLDASRKEELDKAIAELTLAIERLGAAEAQSELASGHHQRGRAIKHQADQLVFEGKASEAAPYFEKALKDFFTAAELDANRVDSLGEIILVRARQGAPRQAIDDVEAALPRIEKKAARAKAHEMLGVLYHQSGALEKARAHYEKALELNQEMIGSLVGLAGVHIARDEAEEAQARLEESIRIVPNFLEGHYRLGQFFISQKRPTEAIASFEAALRVPRAQARTIEMNPSRNIARTRLYYGAASALAWLYIAEENDPLKAGQAVELARRFQDPDPHLLDTIGWIYYKSGNHEKAMETFEEVIEASGGFAAVHYHLAASYAKLNRKEEALREVKQALAGDESFSQRPEAEALLKELSGESER